MEFLRFGSSIPGGYWGCCACCIIQDFNQDPDDKASIQLVSGDGGYGITKGNDFLFAGPTYKDIFHQRLRVGTFDTRDMPNHGFIAILTHNQINGSIGGKWLKLLKEAGFEFIRTVCNSVYSGQGLLGGSAPSDANQNHIFGLFRNIGAGAIKDPFTPPKAWTNLPKVVPEAWNAMFSETLDVFNDDAVNAKGEPIEGGAECEYSSTEMLAKVQRTRQLAVWEKIGPAKFLTEAELVAAKAPVIYAGVRTEFPPEPKAAREKKMEAKSGKQDSLRSGPVGLGGLQSGAPAG